MAEYFEMFTLKEEYTTHHFAKNWQSILKMMTAKRAHFFLFGSSPTFLSLQCVFSPPPPFPLVLNAKNVTLWLHRRLNLGAEQEISRCGVLLLFHRSALSSVVIFLAILPPAVHAITDSCFMWLFTHQIRATTHPSLSDLKPGTKDTIKFQNLPYTGYISLTLSPLCFPSPLQKYRVSKAGALFRGEICIRGFI